MAGFEPRTVLETKRPFCQLRYNHCVLVLFLIFAARSLILRQMLWLIYSAVAAKALDTNVAI